jgi:Leucine-rich repeat (LRR) protein
VNWWKQLEKQWQEAFKVVLDHTNDPEPAEPDALYKMQTLRLAGPAAPFPNLPFELTNLSGIQNLLNLEILIITHHKIDNIEVLNHLTKLKSVFLFNNCITDLKGIETLSQLEQLYVQYNRITSIKPVKQLVHLKELYINNNLIATLDGLTEKHSENLKMFVCRPNEQLKQKEIIYVERELGIICRGL